MKSGFSKPVEGGGEFIHGNPDLTISLLKQAGIKYYETEGELWQLKNNKLVKRKDFYRACRSADEKTKRAKAGY